MKLSRRFGLPHGGKNLSREVHGCVDVWRMAEKTGEDDPSGPLELNRRRDEVPGVHRQSQLVYAAGRIGGRDPARVFGRDGDDQVEALAVLALERLVPT